MKVKISAIEYYLAPAAEGTDELVRDNPDWEIPKILEKTGVYERRIADPGVTAGDLAFEAAKVLLDRTGRRQDVDLVLLVTQSPDYILPTTACILQSRLGLRKNSMAFDVNLGCSGFVYALSIVGGLIQSGVTKLALILCAETYSKYIHKSDRTCRPLFSDGAAAVLVEGSEHDCVGPFEFGTDGSGYDKLIVRSGGARNPGVNESRSLEMLGSDVFLFTMSAVPAAVNAVLAKAGVALGDVDLFVFHQASKLVVDNLVRRMALDRAKVFENYARIGNTVSATIPIALKDAADQGRLEEGDRVMLVGFGVGLSWGATLISWSTLT